VQAQQLSVKIFADESSELDQEALIPVFHRWIRERRLAERVLIDVADYRHVHNGPGVMIVAHDAHYGLDEAEGKLGLLYCRKRDPVGDVGPKLEEAFVQALTASVLLEQEFAGTLRFRGDRLRLEIRSRLVADNTPAALAELRPHLDAFLGTLYAGADFEVSQVGDERAPFAVEISSPGAGSIAGLLDRLGGPSAPLG
jgi:hypothetical protein